MEHIQKDDIIIRKGILHILDSHTGYLGLSSQLLEMGPDLMEFVRGHIFKIMESDDAKRCQFNGSVSRLTQYGHITFYDAFYIFTYGKLTTTRFFT